MTIICARDGIMASDTMGVNGFGIKSFEETKLYRSPYNGIIGFAGDADYSSVFLEWYYERGYDRSSFPSIPKHGDFVALLMEDDGQLFISSSDDKGKFFMRHHEFYAVGAGAQFAMGAMAQGATAEEAVALCIKHCAECGGEVQVMRLTDQAV